MRLAAPRALGRKAQEVRVGGNRDAEAGGERVDHVLAPDAREVEGLGRASAVSGTRGVAEETLPVFVAQDREQHVAPGVHVVRHEQELAESRLSQVFGQQLDVAAPQVLPRGRGNRGGAANEIPQLRDRPVEDDRAGERRPQQPPDRAVPHPPPRRRAPAVEREPGGQRGDRHEQAEDDEARNDGREHRRRKESVDRPRVGGADGRRRVAQGEQRQQHGNQRGDHADGAQRERHGEQAGGGHERPAHDPERRAPAIRLRDARLLPQPGGFPEPLPAVDRGEHRPHRADAAAGHEIDPDARLVQRAQHAGVIRPGGAGPGEHERGAQPRRVRAIRRV